MANRIHHTAYIGEGVELGADNVIGPFAMIVGPTVIGSDNWIGPHAAIGTPASHHAAPHPAAWDTAPVGDPDVDGHGVVIGDRNRIREYVSVHQGFQRPTTVGSDGYYLRGCHVAHDLLIGDNVTIGSNVALGGHTEIWSWANLGMGAAVHQHGRIGPGAMVGMGAIVRQEIGAFTVNVGVPSRTAGINATGLSRMGVSEQGLVALRGYLLDHGRRDMVEVELPAEVERLLAAWERRDRRADADD